MPADPLAGILKEGRTVRLPAQAKEAAVDRLERRGFLRVVRQETVACVNPLDDDQRYLKDRSCDGVRAIEPHLDEDDHAYRCPDCGRVLFPSRKRKSRRLRLWPDHDAIDSWLDEGIRGLDRPVTRALAGLWRVSTAAGEVEVCFVDLCPDRSVLDPHYPRAGMVVFVLGNDRDFRRYLPEGAPVFRVVDLVEQGAGPLRRKVRQLGRAADAPAVVRARGGLPAPAPSSPPERFAGVARHAAPSGTRWNEVHVYEVDGLTVQIRVPGRAPASFTAAELGMANKRKRDRGATKKWWVLMALCRGQGSCGWRGLANSFDAFKGQVSSLRPLLQHIVGIDADPFTACTNAGGLRAAFNAGPLPEDEVYVGEDRW